MDPLPEPRMVEVVLGRIVIREHADRQYVYLVERGGQRQGQALVAELEALGRTALQERQGLQGLDRAAREDRLVGVAGAVEHATGGVDQDPRAAVLGLDVRAAPDAGQDRIVGPQGARGGRSGCGGGVHGDAPF